MSEVVEPDVSDQERPYRIAVLDKAMLVLDTFVRHGPVLSLGEISALTGINVSTTMRLLVNLRYHGMVARSEDNGKYSLGYRLLTFADAARGRSSLVEFALPAMRDLTREFNETSVLSVRSGDHRIDLEQVVGNQTVRRVLTLGQPKSLYSGAASRVLLAGFSAKELQSYLERVPLVKIATDTIIDPEVLKASLIEIRANGYAWSKQEQADNSGAGVVAPILGVRGEIIAALGISVPQFRFTNELRDRLIPAVKKAAESVSARISMSTGT